MSANAKKIESLSHKKKIRARACRHSGERIRLERRPENEKSVLSYETRENLIIENRPRARKLARSILRRWHSRLDLEEVDSIVDLSLCEAAQRFNPEMGAGFMTFLFYHLRGNLIRAVTLAATANTVPINEVSSIADTDREFGGNKAISLMNAVEVAGALNGHEYAAPDEALAKKELIGISKDAREHLDYLEKEVIERIYMNEEQLLDIAKDLGYSRCHISRIKRKALEALYNGMSTLAGEEVAGRRPDFNDDDYEETPAAHKEIRRKITTRRPRSQRAQKIQLDALRD